jgi:hypothetical protein
MTSGRPRWSRSLAFWVPLAALVTGALVTVFSSVAGAGNCAVDAGPGGLPPEPPDAVCYQLVRTMSERVGLVTAVATVIVVLTMVAVSRMARGSGMARGPG